ncbi:MAG: glycosyltransferase [Fervidobacterium sp.]|uniref:glycosyltransferase n=1 Tax=Fervidobacterium sp. TaxID=1871331 RepID=UPI00404B07F9
MNKKYLIATACNEKYENFLLNHWFRSLRENVRLDQIDILVIDYGLSKSIVEELEGYGVILKKAENTNGLINNTRFIEISEFLRTHPEYEQVIVADSGDIIFQADFSEVFQVSHDKVKAVVEEVSPAIGIIINEKNITNYKEMNQVLSNKKLINVGFVVYPSKVFIEITSEMVKYSKDLYIWGIDTVFPNYYAYKHGFYQLHPKYNFIPTTTRKKYKVRNGKFYLVESGKVELIPVVHNAGRHKLFRAILNFGYGEGYNIPRPLTIFALRTFYQFLSLFKSKK